MRGGFVHTSLQKRLMSGVWPGLDEDDDGCVCMCVGEGPGRDHRETIHF